MLKGYNFVRRDGVVFFSLVVLLVWEFSNDSTIRVIAHSLNLMAAVVILTVKKGLSDGTSRRPHAMMILNLRTLVHLAGTPLLRVIYRDSEFLPIYP